MSVAQPQPAQHTPRPAAIGWIITVVVNILLPIATYLVLTNLGVGEVPALMLSGVWPLGELAFSWMRQGHPDEFSIFALVFVVIGMLTTLLFNDARLLLLKESATTGLFGLALLGSLALPRPLMFYFGRKFGTDGSREGIRYWNGLWQYPGFRRGQRILTLVWGMVLLIEAVGRILLTLALPIGVMVVVNSVLPIVVLAGLVAGTTVYGKRAGKATQARIAAAQAATPPPAVAT